MKKHKKGESMLKYSQRSYHPNQKTSGGGGGGREHCGYFQGPHLMIGCVEHHPGRGDYMKL